jgi:hypothetical protein
MLLVPRRPNSTILLLPQQIALVPNLFPRVMSLRRVASESATQVCMERDPLMNHDTSGHIWLKVPRLLYFHEIPRWQQDNEYLLSGYRYLVYQCMHMT